MCACYKVCYHVTICRAENTHKGKQATYEKDLNMLYWSNNGKCRCRNDWECTFVNGILIL